MPYIGEYSVSYYYVRTRYHWTVDDYSYYKTAVEISGIVTQSILISLVSYLKFKNTPVLVFVGLSIFLRNIIKALAAESWMYYMGAMVDILGSYNFALLRAMISECVPKYEIGKVLSVFTCLESLLPIGVSQAYSVVWKKFNETYPGAVFLLSGVFSLINVIIALYFLKNLKGQSISYYYELWSSEKQNAADNDEKKDEVKDRSNDIELNAYKLHMEDYPDNSKVTSHRETFEKQNEADNEEKKDEVKDTSNVIELNAYKLHMEDYPDNSKVTSHRETFEKQNEADNEEKKDEVKDTSNVVELNAYKLHMEDYPDNTEVTSHREIFEKQNEADNEEKKDEVKDKSNVVELNAYKLHMEDYPDNSEVTSHRET